MYYIAMINEDGNYDHFIDRTLGDPFGRQFKIADIKDNLDVTRIGELTEKDRIRLNKYKKVLTRLTGS